MTFEVAKASLIGILTETDAAVSVLNQRCCICCIPVVLGCIVFLFCFFLRSRSRKAEVAFFMFIIFLNIYTLNIL